MDIEANHSNQMSKYKGMRKQVDEYDKFIPSSLCTIVSEFTHEIKPDKNAIILDDNIQSFGYIKNKIF